eukprot:c29369_g1_i1.p1 GENE.c29369_g1_i1~~c29369_g1_i1.p1  ORF type:complete len:214 (+),score=50.89 c29369_g1_i1:3-644(+)
MPAENPQTTRAGEALLSELAKAVRRGDVPQIKGILHSDPSVVNAYLDEDEHTAAHTAANNGKIDVLEILIEHGANLDIPNHDGWTPVYSAVMDGDETVLELLLKSGAGVNMLDEDGWTPLCVASYVGDIHIVQLLLKYRANPSKTSFGVCPRQKALEQGHFTLVDVLDKAMLRKQVQTFLMGTLRRQEPPEGLVRILPIDVLEMIVSFVDLPK